MRKVVYLLFFVLMISCTDQKLRKDKRSKSGSKEDSAGRIYNTTREKDDNLFRLIKRDGALLFKENSVTSEHYLSISSNSFVEVVDDPNGILIKVRVPHEMRGYIEGYVKESYLFDTRFYGKPLKLSKDEIERLKEIERKIELRRIEKERKELERLKEERESIAREIAGSDLITIMGKNYSTLTKYLKKQGYKEDLRYAETATQSVKFIKNNSFFYVTLQSGVVTGFSITDNVDGFSEQELDVILLTYIGEIFYSVNEEYKINDNIIKFFCKSERKLQSLTIKRDRSKPQPIIEIVGGDFSGIE